MYIEMQLFFFSVQADRLFRFETAYLLEHFR